MWPRGHNKTKAIKSHHWINSILLCSKCQGNYPLSHHDKKHAHRTIHTHTHTNTHRLTHTITVAMVKHCWENDCFSIGMILCSHRAAVCMLILLKRLQRGPGAITLPQKTGEDTETFFFFFMSVSILKTITLHIAGINWEVNSKKIKIKKLITEKKWRIKDPPEPEQTTQMKIYCEHLWDMIRVKMIKKIRVTRYRKKSQTAVWCFWFKKKKKASVCKHIQLCTIWDHC